MNIQGGNKRKSLRLEGYDCSNPGAYFVTLISNEFSCIFGEVHSGQVILTEFGQIAREEWFNYSIVRHEIILQEDDFVVMPNHVHGIVWIEPTRGLQRTSSKIVDVRAIG